VHTRKTIGLDGPDRLLIEAAPPRESNIRHEKKRERKKARSEKGESFKCAAITTNPEKANDQVRPLEEWEKDRVEKSNKNKTVLNINRGVLGVQGEARLTREGKGTAVAKKPPFERDCSLKPGKY